MNTLVIHNEEGKVVFTRENANVGGFESLVTTVPEGKYIVSVDPVTKEAIFADIPPSEIESLRGYLEDAILELSMLMSMGGM